MTRVRGRIARQRGRTVWMLTFVAALAVLQLPAAAEIKLPQLPIPTATPLLDSLLHPITEPVSETLGNVTGLLGETTEETTGLGGGKKPHPGVVDPEPPDPATVQPPKTGSSWSVDRAPTAGSSAGGTVRVDSTKVVRPPMSYGAAVADSFARTVRRAATLAGPVAAPMIFALLAVGLLYVAAGGPGRLIKVEEERNALRDLRTYRL